MTGLLPSIGSSRFCATTVNQIITLFAVIFWTVSGQATEPENRDTKIPLEGFIFQLVDQSKNDCRQPESDRPWVAYYDQAKDRYSIEPLEPGITENINDDDQPCTPASSYQLRFARTSLDYVQSAVAHDIFYALVVIGTGQNQPLTVTYLAEYHLQVSIPRDEEIISMELWHGEYSFKAVNQKTQLTTYLSPKGFSATDQAQIMIQNSLNWAANQL